MPLQPDDDVPRKMLAEQLTDLARDDELFDFESEFLLEAASTITSLQEMNRKLAEALKPFADYAAYVASEHPGWDHDQCLLDLPAGRKNFPFAFFRRARALLSGAGE